MSGKTVAARPKKMDQRVRRTRNALGDALLELMQERKFEEITVQHVLDRAGVGRSTFYEHYQDKNDLFLSDMEEFFEMMSTLLIRREESSKRVAPVSEFFAHVGEMRHLYSALAAGNKLHDFQEMAQEYFARAIRKRLEQLSSPAISPAQSAASSQALAGALMSLMSWWVQSGATASAEEMDALFHQMVWAGVSPSSNWPIPKKAAGIPKPQILRRRRSQKNERKIRRASP